MSARLTRIIGPGFLSRCSARVRRVHAYWDGKRNGRKMPARADIDPIELCDVLSSIILIDVWRSPVRLTYRLVGTDEVLARGSDPTGKDVRANVFSSDVEEGFRTYLLAMELGVPIYDEEPTDCPDPRLTRVASLVLPLSSDDQQVNMLLAFVDYRREL